MREEQSRVWTGLLRGGYICLNEANIYDKKGSRVRWSDQKVGFILIGWPGEGSDWVGLGRVGHPPNIATRCLYCCKILSCFSVKWGDPTDNSGRVALVSTKGLTGTDDKVWFLLCNSDSNSWEVHLVRSLDFSFSPSFGLVSCSKSAGNEEGGFSKEK